MSKSTRYNVYFTPRQSNTVAVGLLYQTRFTHTTKNKTMVHISHRIGIKASPDKVYNALATIEGLGNWWTEEVVGDETPGGKIQFTFRTEAGDVKGQMVMEVKELAPPQRVSWHCVQGPEEWIGTDVIFNLSEQNNQTIVIFKHRNWREAVEFTAHCSMKWAVFLLSLRQYVETGKGQPSPNDIKIDNWN